MTAMITSLHSFSLNENMSLEKCLFLTCILFKLWPDFGICRNGRPAVAILDLEVVAVIVQCK